MTAIIKFDKVGKSYGATPILSEFDFRVQQGETVSLIGGSGSGKSTILRILMGLEPYQDGAVTVDGLALPDERMRSRQERRMREVRNLLGMVFQHFHLFPHMTVLRNVSHALVRVQGMERRDAERRALGLLEMVGLEGRAQAFPHDLSGGQQQRVAIARALAPEPAIMLFDEPTSALDPELVVGVMETIESVTQRLGITSLIVTHELGFARRISDRICRLDKGRIIADGSPSEVLGPGSPRTDSARAGRSEPKLAG